MADFRFGRQPFRFEPTVFQEPRPEIRAYQTYKPTPRDRYSQVMSLPEVEAQSSQPAGTEKGSLFDLQRQEENEYPMMEKFSELLSQRPVREDYKPSIWRNIVSAVGGASSGMLGKPENAVQNAFATTEKLRDVPFDRATSDWGAKIGGYGEGAKLELQKADKENKFLNMLNTAYRNQGQNERWQGQTANEADRNRIRQQEVLNKIQQGVAQGWKPVRADGKIMLVKAGEQPQIVGDDTLAGIQQQNANTAAAGQVSRDVIGRGNLANQIARTGIMQQDSNTRVSQAEIGLMNAETRQDQAAINYYRAQIAGEQFNRQLGNDIFNQALRQAEFDRGDKSPEARAMLPSQQLAAYNLTMFEVLNDNPELMDILDENNRVDPNADPDMLDNFTFLMRQRMAAKLNPSKDVGMPNPPKPVFPKTPTRNAPAPPPPPRGSGLTFPSPGSVTTPSPPTATSPLTFKRVDELKK